MDLNPHTSSSSSKSEFHDWLCLPLLTTTLDLEQFFCVHLASNTVVSQLLCTLHLRLPWSLILVMSIRWSDPMQWSAQRHLAQQPICAFMISASLRVLTLRSENMALKFLTLGMAPLRTFLPHSLAGSWHLRYSWYPSLRELSPSEHSGVSSSYSDVWLLKQNCFR